jgi:hypothetical protein
LEKPLKCANCAMIDLAKVFFKLFKKFFSQAKVFFGHVNFFRFFKIV